MSCLIGASVPALLGSYDHDHAPNPHHPDWPVCFTPGLAYRYLAAGRSLGLGALRLWLCENGEGVLLDGDGRIAGVHPDLLEAVRVWQDGARQTGMKLYFSVLDANAWLRNGCSITGAVLGSDEGARRFAEHVLTPLLAVFDPQVLCAVELVNEPEAASSEVEEGGLGWERLRASLDVLGQAAARRRPELPRLVGSQACFLPGLLGEAAPSWLSAIDIHAYHPGGGLPGRADLPATAAALPLWAGEVGASSETPDDFGYLVNAIFNGRAQGYQAVFLWKLEGELLERRQDARGAPVFWPTTLGESVRKTMLGD